VEAVDERLSVGGDQNRADGCDTGGISGDELLPENCFASRQIDSIDFGGNLSGLVHKKTVTVLTPTRRQIAGFKSGNEPVLPLS